MGNIKAIDKDSASIEIAADGTGTTADPFIPHHKITNFPATQPVSGSVAVSNFPATQLISGSVSVANFPATQPVSGSVAVSNFPATQLISGEVQVSNFPATQLISGSVSVANFPATQPVSGSVAVSNFPATQPVSGSVAVSNFPATQPVSGSVAVSNFPATQPVSGSVAVSNFPATQSIIDSQNTFTDSLIPLTANQSFTGSSRTASNKNTVRGWVWTDKNGTLFVDQSINNSTWRQTDSFSISGSTTQATTYLFRLAAPYYRLRYVNGGATQTTFELISTSFGIGL